MALSQASLEIRTNPKSFLDITSQVQDFVTKSNIQNGVCHLFIKHTSASLVIQENYDPSVRQDFETIFSKLAPEDFPYVHNMEGKDDMPAHIKGALTQTHLNIPICEGKMALGKYQGIFLFEHRRCPRDRELILHIIGN